MTTTDTAEAQAKAQLETIASLVQRLEHTRECGYITGSGVCALDKQIIIDTFGSTYYRDGQRHEYHDKDAASQAMKDHPLSVLVRSGWYSPEDAIAAMARLPAEYEILLCTGGPAVRIRGDLDNGEPSTVRLDYQDWGTPWTQYLGPDLTTFQANHAVLLAFARHFYFGE